MSQEKPHSDLIDHLVRSSALTPQQSSKLVEEIITYFNESIEQYVQRRHRQLQENGLRNSEIFDAIENELSLMRFPAPKLSLRQMRRMVYG